MLHALALLIAAPTFVWGFLYVGLACATGCAEKMHIRGRVMPTATWTPWFARWWKYSTTVCRGIIMHPGTAHPDTLWDHETVHVRQAEDLCAIGLALGTVSGELLPMLVIWMLSPFGLILNYVMAGLRHGKLAVYREAEHEAAAYAQTDHKHG